MKKEKKREKKKRKDTKTKSDRIAIQTTDQARQLCFFSLFLEKESNLSQGHTESSQPQRAKTAFSSAPSPMCWIDVV